MTRTLLHVAVAVAVMGAILTGMILWMNVGSILARHNNTKNVPIVQVCNATVVSSNNSKYEGISYHAQSDSFSCKEGNWPSEIGIDAHNLLDLHVGDVLIITIAKEPKP